MCKFVMVLLVGMLMLAGCKKDDAKNFSDGCQYGSLGVVSGLFHVNPPQDLFQAPCDALAQDYVNGKVPKLPNAPAPKK